LKLDWAPLLHGAAGGTQLEFANKGFFGGKFPDVKIINQLKQHKWDFKFTSEYKDNILMSIFV
jgi:hypothetical protein